MLEIKIPSIELYDEIKQEFIQTKARTLHLEHSLVSLSKWESKYKKPFLVKEPRTREETLDYIKCMTITQNVPDDAYKYLSKQNIDEISQYIDSPMTATTIKESKKPPNREIITSEIIYYWMITHGIPMECQKWHLDRLFTLINVCAIKSQGPNKLGKRDLMARNRELNRARKNKLNSKG